MSVNGFIADKKGNEDFLSDINWQIFSQLAKKHEAIIVGRKTYEAVLKWRDFNFDTLKIDTKIVISRQMNYKLKPGYVLVNSAKEAISKLKALNRKSAVLAGGSNLNFYFLKQGLVDEMVLNIEPVLLGQGIPLLSENKFEKELKFVDCKRISQGILQLKYKVKK